jgi:hypothetical protein
MFHVKQFPNSPHVRDVSRETISSLSHTRRQVTELATFRQIGYGYHLSEAQHTALLAGLAQVERLHAEVFHFVATYQE